MHAAAGVVAHGVTLVDGGAQHGAVAGRWGLLETLEEGFGVVPFGVFGLEDGALPLVHRVQQAGLLLSLLQSLLLRVFRASKH